MLTILNVEIYYRQHQFQTITLLFIADTHQLSCWTEMIKRSKDKENPSSQPYIHRGNFDDTGTRMASRLLAASGCLVQSLGRLSLATTAGPLVQQRVQLPTVTAIRHTSFFNKCT